LHISKLNYVPLEVHSEEDKISAQQSSRNCLLYRSERLTALHYRNLILSTTRWPNSIKWHREENGHKPEQIANCTLSRCAAEGSEGAL